MSNFSESNEELGEATIRGKDLIRRSLLQDSFVFEIHRRRIPNEC